MFLWLHIFLALAILVLLSYDLSQKGGNKYCVMALRTMYIIMLLDGLWLYPLSWMHGPIIAFLKVVLSILVICYLEFLVTRRFQNTITKKDIWLGVLFLAFLIILGICLTQGRPWVQVAESPAMVKAYMMIPGFKFIQTMSPWMSIDVLVGFILFAMGFAVTLVMTITSQWGKKTQNAKKIPVGLALIVLAVIVVTAPVWA